MREVAKNLKALVARITRQEFEKCAARTKAMMLEHRQTMEALRKQVARLERELEQWRGAASRDGDGLHRDGLHRDGHDPLTSGNTHDKHRFSPKGVRAHRRRLELSASQFGELLGVSAQSIYAWEQGRVRPRPKQLAALVALRNMGKRQLRELQLQRKGLDRSV